MISCEKDGPYIGFSHCPVCSAKYATEMGQTIRKLETALAAMTAERDARDVALRAAVASCKCRGTGQVQRWCTLCGDSTFDHDCNDRMEDCDRDWCIAARAVLARAAVEGER